MTNLLTELITLSFMFDLFRRPASEIVSLSKLHGDVASSASYTPSEPGGLN